MLLRQSVTGIEYVDAMAYLVFANTRNDPTV
jgi:hypothetical protein